jgi:hypothetical protein
MSAGLQRTLGAIALALALVAPMVLAPVWAQQAPVRVRGTVERVDGDTYIIKSRDGTQLKLKLAPKATVGAVVAAKLADIKQGSYVGVAALPLPDGSQKALEVHIFPEPMRGTGDGHRGWDLQPSSTMTNGNVEKTTASADGQVLILSYKGGEKRIVVPAGVPIVAYAPADASELKAGARIFIAAATRQPDGSLVAARVNVGRGIAPPM